MRGRPGRSPTTEGPDRIPLFSARDKRSKPSSRRSPSAPRPREPDFWVWGRSGRPGLRGLSSIHRDPAARAWLQGSPASAGRVGLPHWAPPGAAREDGGRGATAPPALATGQAQRHLSALQPAAPTPRSCFRGDSGREAPRRGKKRGKGKNARTKTKPQKQNKKPQPPLRHSPPSLIPPAATGLAGRLRSAEPGVRWGGSPRPGPRILRRASRRPATGRRAGAAAQAGDEAQGTVHPSVPAWPRAPGSPRAQLLREGGSRLDENGAGSGPSPPPPSPVLRRRGLHFAEKQENAIHTQELSEGKRVGETEKGSRGCVKKQGEEIGKADFSCSAAVTPGPPSPPARGPAEPRSLLRGSRAAPGGGIHTHSHTHTLAHTRRTQLI